MLKLPGFVYSIYENIGFLSVLLPELPPSLIVPLVVFGALHTSIRTFDFLNLPGKLIL